ncbi:Isopentenyl-diphosphate delta-isomerase [Raoultella terrigena]|uniref:Isopentenyl-diphosphate delta-isomerase n=1 Tax=Raoultella terrigena TaxID=577 RepID=A0A7Z8Z778_RAOTE|nr:Isopentenyl-diphosphate delta-isomerase [Raoultella terrigena]
MTGEHVILLDEQDKPAGMLEKYAATPSIPHCTSRFPAGCLTHGASCWSPGARWRRKPGRESGRIRSADTLRRAKPSSRPSRGAAALSSAPKSPLSRRSPPQFPATGRSSHGIVENEVCPVYAARVTGPLRPNSDEVMDYQWCPLQDLLNALAITPWAFSPWMVLEATDAGAALQDYAASLR